MTTGGHGELQLAETFCTAKTAYDAETACSKDRFCLSSKIFNSEDNSKIQQIYVDQLLQLRSFKIIMTIDLNLNICIHSGKKQSVNLQLWTTTSSVAHHQFPVTTGSTTLSFSGRSRNERRVTDVAPRPSQKI